ncbi:type IX secretion system outer membrane channel protein PorV [Flavihumibacter profundi]|uniref:type IX secretion system outer membrane channel protein PorV n=1 Tax=Flavihumibacter profundi TaxID=2716883 RepID=UPI001CC7BB15|nr:type IX secretion system outer membrane channel protein PorV [Flavihumibacter profundi]MBZ5858438.1 type IX secretion system outer membrane channel protein PorV [Flavihumibacter profundi]
MNHNFLKLALSLCITGFTAMQARSQTTEPINVVTTAVPFLRISPDARSGGMGEVGIATTADVNAPFLNLAKTPFNTSKGAIGLTYTPWLKRLGLNDVYMVTASGYGKIGDNDDQAISASLRYFNLGDIQFTDNQGNEFGSFRPREFSFDVGYSRKLSEKIGLGIALRYIYSNLAGGQNVNGTTYQAGNAVAGDITFYYNGTNAVGEGFSGGATATNLGTKIGYTTDATQKDFIPANLGLGGTYTKVFDESNKITFGMDFNKLMVPTPPASGDSAGLAEYHSIPVVKSWFTSFSDAPGGFSEELREWTISTGIEYWYQDQFALRTGYFYEDKTKGNRQYFTVGMGIKYNVFGLNFSYIIPSGSGVNQNPLSNTLRLGLIFDLGGGDGKTGSSLNQ